MAQSILQSIWPSYLQPILNQLGQQSSVTLYAIPVVTVLAFCLLVFTFGFKTVTLPVDPVASEETKKGKSKSKAKQKSKQSSPSQNQVKANGSANHVNHQQKQQQNQQAAKPKAVVQPLKRDKVVEKSKKNQPEKESEVDVADLDSGEWVTVSSKKANKNQEKLQAKKKEAKVKESSVSTKENDKKVPPVVEDDIPQSVESAWTAVDEEPIEFEDTRALKKKPGKKQKEKISSKKLPEPESIMEPQRVPEDKITSTVIASYDSVAEQKPKKKSEAKKANKKSDKGSEVKVQTPGEEAKGAKLLGVDSAPVLPPELPSNKLSTPVVPPAPSSSTDITDGMYESIVLRTYSNYLFTFEPFAQQQNPIHPKANSRLYGRERPGANDAIKFELSLFLSLLSLPLSSSFSSSL